MNQENDSFDSRPELERLAAQFIEEQRTGRYVTIDSYANKFPEIADQIRELFPTVLKMEQLRIGRSGKRSDGRIDSGPSKLKQLGDFLIVGELGRGGMGVVYEAVQQSLERRVALKILPKHVFRDNRLDDFLAEAKVSAKLHHTNIVPIYGVGRQDGVNYYVMQLIEGVSLDIFVARVEEHDFPEQLSPMRVAEIGRQVALALSYAHQQGTLHRDIKPGNLLQDDQGNIWVADFGLAFNEPESTDGTVQVSGTLRYLPPERFSGSYDERSDIFSLGITLIELLTGRPAYDAGSQEELLNNIQSGAIGGLQRMGNAVPKDLRVILARATDSNSANRFQTAADLADDLDNFLHGRPIVSRRFSKMERAWRWAKCNPSLASMSAVAILLLMTVTAVTSVGYFKVSQSYDAELAQRQRAEVVSDLASSAMDRIFYRFSPDSLFADSSSFETSIRQPILSYEAVALLQELLRFYRHLSVNESANLEIRLKSALAQGKVGEINERLGVYEMASAAFESALIKIRNLPSEQLKENRIFEARILNQLGAVYSLMDKPELAKESILAAIDILELASDGNDEFCLEEARSYYYLARRIRPGMGPESLPPNESSTRWGGLRQVPVEVDRHRRNHLSLAIDLVNQSELSQADNPKGAQFKHLLALCYRELADDDYSQRTEQDREAEEKAISLLQGLVKLYPEQNLFRFDLMETLAEVKVFGDSVPSEQIEYIRQHLQSALVEANYLVKKRPDVVEYRVALIHANFKLASILEMEARLVDRLKVKTSKKELLEQADRCMQRAIFEQRNLVQVYPAAVGYKTWMIRFLITMSRLKDSQGKLDQAERFARRAANTISQLPKSMNQVWIVDAMKLEVAELLARVQARNEE